MADDVFSAFPALPGARVPGSAEVIYLQRALFVLRGQFFDPIANADAPLPEHRWAIAHSDTVFAEGTTSDADGVSTIFEPNLTDVPADAQWDLYLVPIFTGRPDSDIYAERGEAWIDVERKCWVPSDEIELEQLTARKLLRIPLWSSKRKAATGGFVGSYPHSPDFATTGLLRTSELEPHGSKSSPWVMQVDHGWLRTYVQMRCYDPVAKADRHVPQGLLLQVKNDTKSIAGRVTTGSSSVLLPSGSIYVVHAGLKGDFPGLFYEFWTAKHSLFGYADGKPLTIETFDTVRLATHYPLPRVWGSLGHDGWIGPKPADGGRRKPFTDLRHEGTVPDQPLCFHLDDMALAVTAASAFGLAPDGKWELESNRVCVFDALLAIRGQTKDGDLPLPYSKFVLVRYPMPAEETFFVRGEGFEKMTRAIEYEGRIFGVDFQRVGGTPGQNPLVGARAALLETGVGKSTCEVHLLDTRWIRHTYQSVSARLAHLLVYVPTFITALDIDKDENGNNAARTMGVDRCLRALHKATLLWDQHHPAHPAGSDPRKDYAIVPSAGLTDKDTVIRVRHHFGVRKQHERVDVSSGTDELITINIHPQAGRATGGDPMELYLVSGPDIDAKPVKKHPKPTATLYFEPEIGGRTDRIDEVPGSRFMLAHELGHSMGLPDEYIEHVTPVPTTTGDVGAFSGRARPYQLDFMSMMQGDFVPRLRYLWPLVVDLAAFVPKPMFRWLKDAQPFIAQYVAGKHKLRYSLPKGAGKFGDAPDPWTMRSAIVGLAELFLFLAGDDESTRGPIITPPSTPILDQAFDGVMVVTSKFWFTFDDSIKQAVDRWEVFYDEFGALYYDREACPKFFIQSSGPWLRRVLVLLQPRLEFGPNPTRKIKDGKLEELSTANIEVRVHKGLSARKRDDTKDPHVLSIRKGDVGHFLMRYSLTPTQQVFDDRNNGAIRADDLAGINAWFAKTFGRASKVVPL